MFACTQDLDTTSLMSSQYIQYFALVFMTARGAYHRGCVLASIIVGARVIHVCPIHQVTPSPVQTPLPLPKKYIVVVRTWILTEIYCSTFLTT